jgi:hypothetical protein
VTEVVRSFMRPDGEQKVSIVRLETGAFAIEEETRMWEEAGPFSGDGFFYWCPTLEGRSLFDSLAIAETEVMGRFPWASLQSHNRR